jgi:peptidyl-prolyl cis-trans isomerase D
MLRLMRDYATSWMIKVILGAIVIVFVFWGVGSFRNRKANIIATVNEEAITLDDYRSVYNRLLEQTRQRFGGSLNEEMLKLLQLKRQALDQLIDQQLMLQKAADLKFRVTDTEIIDSIKRIEAFQSDGKFDGRLYARVLNYNRLTPEGFEKIQQKSLLVEKLQSYLFSNVQVSASEVKEFYMWKNASVAIDYLLIEPDSYKDIETEDEEIQTYFDANKERYKTEPRAKAEYIHFDPEKYKADVNVSDEEIEAYYMNHKKTFESPKTVEARHILFKTDQNAPEEAVEAQRAKAAEVLEQIKKGADFASVAKEYSEGPTKDNGGYLGTFKKEDMVAPFAEKAFSMNPGEVSEPVKTQFGWHLIKVEKVNAASVKSLDEARDEIRSKLTMEAAKNLAYDKAEAFYETTMEGDRLAEVGEHAGLDVKTTSWFTASGPESGISDRKKFADAAFALSLDEMSEIQDLNDGYFILQIIEKEPGKIPDLTSVLETVKADLIKEKQASAAENEAKELLVALKDKGPEALNSGGKKSVFKSTGYFKRNEAIPDIGWENEISQAAFNLSKEKPLAGDIIKGRKGYYLIRLKDRRLPDMADYDKEEDTIKETLLSQKKFRALDAWLKQVKNQSEISIQEGFIE